MLENEEKYTAFMELISNSSQIWSLFCGFTFATIAILITLLPNPSQIMSQATLFFMAFLFDVCLFLILFTQLTSAYLHWISPMPQGLPRLALRIHNRLGTLCWILLGIQPILMFLLWNLVYLALASGVVYVLICLLAYFSVFKPYRERLRKLRSSE